MARRAYSTASVLSIILSADFDDEIMGRHCDGSKVLIATSGGVIAVALQKVLQFSDRETINTNWMVHNSSVSRIRYGKGRLSLAQFNNLPHLERLEKQDMITYR